MKYLYFSNEEQEDLCEGRLSRYWPFSGYIKFCSGHVQASELKLSEAKSATALSDGTLYAILKRRFKNEKSISTPINRR